MKHSHAIAVMCLVVLAVSGRLGIAQADSAPAIEPSPEASTAAAPPTTDPPTTDPLIDRLIELERRMGEIEHLRAKFKQLRIIPMLRRPMESSGTVLKRADTLRWDTLEPAPSTMILTPGEIRLYYPDSQILEVYSTQDQEAPAHARGLGSSLAALRDSHDIAEIPIDSFEGARGEHLLAVEFTAHDHPAEGSPSKVRVLIDTAAPMVLRVHMESSDGELTDISLFDIRYDQPASEKELELVVPEGTLISHPAEGSIRGATGGGESDEGSP